MKVKGYWPLASTDEPQVLALAELLQDAKISQESDVLAAVTALAKTESGKRNDFRPTPSMVCDMTVTLRRNRYQQERSRVPSGINSDGSWYDAETGRLAQEHDLVTGEVKVKRIASPESRDIAMAGIRQYLTNGSQDLLDRFGKPTLNVADWQPPSDSPRSELGGTSYGVLHSERLTTDSRKVGIPDTEDEMIQYRWAFEPPHNWPTQPTCGPWVNTQSQAMLDGKAWLVTANRRFGQ